MTILQFLLIIAVSSLSMPLMRKFEIWHDGYRYWKQFGKRKGERKC